MSVLCPVGDCDRAVRAGGMCDAHYRRARKYGDPLFEHSLECVHCGAAFRAWSAVSRYCSGACRERAATLRAGFTCADCLRPMVRGRTSAPQGEARCRECQNGGRGYYEFGDGLRASHGTAYGRGCRCGACTSAQADRMARYMDGYAAVHGLSYSAAWRRRFKDEHGFWPQGSGYDFVSGAERRAIYERDGWTCQLCFEPVDPEAPDLAARPSLDHIVPQSRGGSHDVSNLRLACFGCNARRGNRVDDFEGVA